MALHFALLACLLGPKGHADLPPRPDFVAMIPQTSSIFFGRIQEKCDPERLEAAALATYLNRVWDDAATAANPGAYALALLTVIQQFDTALLTLNPNPTAGEAVARVRAYQPILTLVRREIKRDEANPKQLGPGRLCQLSAQFHRLSTSIVRVYYPLFARTA